MKPDPIYSHNHFNLQSIKFSQKVKAVEETNYWFDWTEKRGWASAMDTMDDYLPHRVDNTNGNDANEDMAVVNLAKDLQVFRTVSTNFNDQSQWHDADFVTKLYIASEIIHEGGSNYQNYSQQLLWNAQGQPLNYVIGPSGHYNCTGGSECEGEYDANRNQIFLKYEAIEHSFIHPDDGENAIAHENSHAMDSRCNGGDGIPANITGANKTKFITERDRLFNTFYQNNNIPLTVQERLQTYNKPSVSDDYWQNKFNGTLLKNYAFYDNAEFYAVTQEYFQENPAEFEIEYPELYAIYTQANKQ